MALYSLEARCCVAWGAGHHSWVAGVAFDTWCARTRIRYL